MELKRMIREELSGNMAKSYVEQIARFHRIQGSTMYHEAAEYIREELLGMGIADATLHQFPADGKTRYWTHTSPLGWEVEDAKLFMVKPENELIVSFLDTPTSLHTFSNATPPEGVEAELIDVGAGTSPKDYEGKDVKGKFVLATGRAKLVHELAVYRHGAAGVITDTITYETPGVRESIDIPDAHAYQAIWPRAEEREKVALGFSLSKRQGNRLRALLNEGKTVRLRAHVDSRLFDGFLDVVEATIQGKEPLEDVFLIAHLCHPAPSANDNASGSGLLLEIARTIKRLIDTEEIPPPNRTIRFLWVPETSGSVAYLSRHPEMIPRLIAGINLDMVGQNQELCRSTLNLDRTPDSLPSFLNDLVFDLIRNSVREFDREAGFGSSSTFRYAENTFSGGSDHSEFNDATVGIPCVMLLQWPDIFYHTSEDTTDKVSPDMLKRVGWIATLGILTLANARINEAFLFTNKTYSRGITRILEEESKAMDELENKKGENEFSELFHYRKKRMEHIMWREKQAVRSVARIGLDEKVRVLIENRCKDIDEIGGREGVRFVEAAQILAQSGGFRIIPEEDTEAVKESRRLVPTRIFSGTLDMDFLKKQLGDQEYEWYKTIEKKDRDFDKKCAEVLNFMDSRRSVYDIVNAVSSEYSPTEHAHVLKFLRDLERLNLISLR
jgi:aminopeptidase YwaD